MVFHVILHVAEVHNLKGYHAFDVVSLNPGAYSVCFSPPGCAQFSAAATLGAARPGAISSDSSTHPMG